MTPAVLRVGGLIFPGFELLDIFGPLELFGMLGEKASLVMMAENPGDMALGLTQHLFDRPTALECARRAEYTWHEDKNLDPFAI